MPLIGHDFLAGARYQDVVLKANSEFVGVFWDTFGPAKPLILKLCAQRKVKAIRVQGIWKDDHVFIGNDVGKAVDIAKQLNEIAKANPHVTFYFSPFCEHRLSGQSMEETLSYLSRYSSHLILVNTPIKGGGYVRGFVNEVHHLDNPGKPPEDYIFSFDGLHCVDSDIEKFKDDHKNALAIVGWVLQYNLKRNHKDKTERPKRKCFPTQKLVKSVRLQLIRSRSKSKLRASRDVWKSHSEQHNDVDLRANKPVFISATRYKSLTVHALNGRKLATLSFGGSMEDGRFTYRCGVYGFKLANQALKLTGKDLVEVRGDGKKLGVVNPIFRVNEYRNTPPKH